MKYIEFKKQVRNFPFFSSSQLATLMPNVQVLKNQLSFWQKSGLIIRLKRGIYLLNEEDRKINPSSLFLASQLISPSYISTEYALSYYGLIPERVHTLTCVTTKKTIVIRNAIGEFQYQHIKQDGFHGYQQVLDKNKLSFFIAEPEKAIVDFFYLNLVRFKEGDRDIFNESYRFQNTSKLKVDKLRHFGKLFESKKLIKIINCFYEWMKLEE